MKAVRLVEVGKPLEMQDIPVPKIGDRDVLVRVKAAGICHSDAHYRAGNSPVYPLPMTLGHEVAGVVEAVGEKVTRAKVGDRVCLHYMVVCGDCYYCSTGNEQFCEKGLMLGHYTDGGYAEYIAVPERNAVPLPEEIPFEQGATLMCASATSFHGLRKGRFQPGERLAVVGIGGLGMSAIQLGRAFGALEVYAVDINPERLALAEKQGAIPIDANQGDPVEQIRALTGGRGVDVAMEIIGLPQTMRQALQKSGPLWPGGDGGHQQQTAGDRHVPRAAGARGRADRLERSPAARAAPVGGTGPARDARPVGRGHADDPAGCRGHQPDTGQLRAVRQRGAHGDRAITRRCKGRPLRRQGKAEMESTESMVIETQGLSKSYGEVQALRDLNLDVPKNSIFGFLGPNGSGKSTTIKLLLGLIEPTAGSAQVFGLDIRRDSVAIRRRIGYLAQDPRYYEHMTARETVRYVARFFYQGQDQLVEARVSEVLHLVGLDEKADRPIKGFSGGERQRLGIAQAQVNYPDLLILDEPAASLDPQGRHDVLAVMERLRKYTTIFYSTHILEDVQRVSDTVAILNHGHLIAQAPIETLLSGGSMIYTITVKGDDEAAQRRVAGLPWVNNLTCQEHNGVNQWQVAVSDEEAAEEQLLRRVLEDRAITVTQFGRKTSNLEDVFLNLVEGSEKNE